MRGAVRQNSSRARGREVSRMLDPARLLTMPRVLIPLLLVLLAACVTPEDGAAEPPAADDPAVAPAAPAGPDPCAAPGACYGTADRLGEFDAELVPEASGLAASVRNPGLYYLIDDGESDRVWVLDPAAGLLGSLDVAGMDEPRDTESLAVGPCGPGDPATCVYVGDTGDNLGGRATVRIHRFVEPDLAAGLPAEVGADSVALDYPDGVANAEALLVDAVGGPHLLTKASFDEETGEAGPARLYRAEGWADGNLVFAGELVLPAPGFGLAAGVVGNVVTGADRHGDRVLVRTYDAVLEYVAPAPGAPLADLPSWPSAEVDGPRLRQPEAVAYRADGCGFLTVSEGSGDVWAVPCERP